ncbi:MAG TPA: ferritin-like domain-containing protein [Phycisphaerae bacterium]|nr:ferritin-like domain-containing protein [Phycisphaerae bacterium]HOJ73380.1 ferritin-like domain-containing protein [Phycisphaerae bacterium]HOM50989.1 ferritin-like domain-containing protein [Phycisphaerae bacterium]HON68354.1 ferritin-like domain-containing protein [Phycisphaerae bacterium]HOQ86414.1 ferritin-like domain-containing protein [Phycisphaerae bacterium]
MAALKSLEDAFIHELQDLLSAEQQLVKALPKMAKKASTPELREAFEEHAAMTETQVERLKQVFESLGRSGRAEKCEGMSGIIKEGESLMSSKNAEPEVLDAELIAAAQKVEHYEIASYGTVCQWAEQLGFDEAHELLGQTLAEEKETDAKLTKLAKKQVNVQAGYEKEE